MESIKVSLRVRPLSDQENQNNDQNIWKINYLNKLNPDIQIRDDCIQKIKQKANFNFENIYDENSQNVQIYDSCIKNFVKGSLDGISGSILLYGPTGCGKTFTMMGSDNQLGILPIAIQDIFKEIQNDESINVIFKCSYYEIYNDQIYDLLQLEQYLLEPLQISEDKNKKEFFIKNLNEISVKNLDDVNKIMQIGEQNRHYAEIDFQHNSSRSHTIFRMNIQTIRSNFSNVIAQLKNQENPDFESYKKLIKQDLEFKQDQTLITSSILNFVDLAGSEKISHSHLDQMKKEGQSINKSLFFLNNLISLKSEGKQDAHIPYRNSPLTKILKSSLTGNSRTLIMLCISPASSQAEKALVTLKFGEKAKKVCNTVTPNLSKKCDDDQLRLVIIDQEQQLYNLKQQILELNEVQKQKSPEKKLNESSLQNQKYDALQKDFKDLQKLYFQIFTNYKTQKKKIKKIEKVLQENFQTLSQQFQLINLQRLKIDTMQRNEISIQKQFNQLLAKSKSKNVFFSEQQSFQSISQHEDNAEIIHNILSKDLGDIDTQIYMLENCQTQQLYQEKIKLDSQQLISDEIVKQKAQKAPNKPNGRSQSTIENQLCTQICQPMRQQTTYNSIILEEDEFDSRKSLKVQDTNIFQIQKQQTNDKKSPKYKYESNISILEENENAQADKIYIKQNQKDTSHFEVTQRQYETYRRRSDLEIIKFENFQNSYDNTAITQLDFTNLLEDSKKQVTLETQETQQSDTLNTQTSENNDKYLNKDQIFQENQNLIQQTIYSNPFYKKKSAQKTPKQLSNTIYYNRPKSNSIHNNPKLESYKKRFQTNRSRIYDQSFDLDLSKTNISTSKTEIIGQFDIEMVEKFKQDYKSLKKRRSRTDRQGEKQKFQSLDLNM